MFAGTSLSDIGALVFLGNIGLFSAILLGIFLLHIVLASGLEAYWLSEVRNDHAVCPRQTRSLTVLVQCALSHANDFQP